MALTRYIATRAATSLATVVVGCVVVFLVMKAAPGDPALAILGENATPEAVAAFRLKHNLDAPVLVQLAAWFAGALHGDLGLSLTIAGGRPIGELIATRLPNTLFIGIFASLIGAALWNRCVAALGPTLTGASFHLVAVYSSALAFLLLGEPVRVFHLVGIALILAGFAIAVLPRRTLPGPRAKTGSEKAGSA